MENYTNEELKEYYKRRNTLSSIFKIIVSILVLSAMYLSKSNDATATFDTSIDKSSDYTPVGFDLGNNRDVKVKKIGSR